LKQSAEHETVGFKTYIITWVTLAILALASLAAAQYHVGELNIVIALTIATVKAVLILYFFMHLRYEGWFFRLALLLPLLVFAFIISFTFLDVVYR
jgi:cytochrome c oxidase subunit 4